MIERAEGVWGRAMLTWKNSLDWYLKAQEERLPWEIAERLEALG
jgi:hypothetical protein